MAVLGLGLAALGRPGYLTVDHGSAIGPDRSIEALREHCVQVCDAAWSGGIRWFDAARSYGRAEEFLAGWLSRRGIQPEQVTVSSKWGYTYTANWEVDAEVPEVKDHSTAALARQWSETEALLGPWLRLYQVHSATLDSGILDDAEAQAELARIGVQATWNLLETSAAPALAEAKAAGWTVIVKEALANGRLATPGHLTATLGEHPDVVALASALAQPWADVVLSGAATVAQLHSNLEALVGVTQADGERRSTIALDPQTYWNQRAAMPWT